MHSDLRVALQVLMHTSRPAITITITCDITGCTHTQAEAPQVNESHLLTRDFFVVVE